MPIYSYEARRIWNSLGSYEEVMSEAERQAQTRRHQQAMDHDTLRYRLMTLAENLQRMEARNAG